MSFEIVRLGDTWVAGLPVRSPKRALGTLSDPNLEAAWTAVLKQDIGDGLASVYTDWSDGIGSYNTQIVGYRTDPSDVRAGHLAARIPGGTYAKFSAVGSFPSVVTSLWAKIDRAEESGDITRAHTGDYEFYPHAYRIDMYVPVVANGGRR